MVFAEAKTTESSRIFITVPEGSAYCSPIHKRMKVCPRKNNATSMGRETIRAARVPWITRPAQIVKAAFRFEGAGQRRKRRGHRGDDLTRIADEQSANGVKRDCSRRQEGANHQVVGVVGDLDGHVDQKGIEAVVPELAQRGASGRPKTTLSCG